MFSLQNWFYRCLCVCNLSPESANSSKETDFATKQHKKHYDLLLPSHHIPNA